MLKVYLAQVKPGQYEASIPWIAELATPMRGPSPSQLKEELMFRALELLNRDLPVHQADRVLCPPDDLKVNSVYLDLEAQLDPGRAPVSMGAVTHVITGRWRGEEMVHLWVPKAPGVCLPLDEVESLYSAATHWASGWVVEQRLSDLSALECNAWGKIEPIEVELGFPEALRHEEDDEASLGRGRMRRPEALNQVATNLTHRAADELLKEAYGREQLVEELLAVLTSPRPVNLCLVGPPGGGKSAIVHEAVRRAYALQRAYQTRRDFWETSGDRIIAGMSIIGQWEQRVTALIEELAERQDVLVVQDLLGLVRAGRTREGGANVARFIEPALEQDRLSLIAEASSESYALARALAPGFVDRFRRVHVPELGWKETLSVMTQLVRRIEGEHDVLRFTPDGIESILSLTRRFHQQEAFPGKAVRLTRACEMHAMRQIHDVHLLTEPLRVDTSMVAEVFARQTGLPRAILEPGMGRAPVVIGELLEQRLYGQPQVIEVITSLLVTVEQGLSDPTRPLATLLLVGPSGVGKTETAKLLAEQLFGSEERLLRFDMSELNTPLATSRLIGTSHHPDGELTGKVRLQPFCVILLDEIEKAHGDVHDLLLQVMGEGRLSDAAGRTVDFRNAIVVMTSNLGASDEDHWLGFKSVEVAERALHYERSAQAFFRPEFFNRIDHVVPYRALGAEALRRIANRTLRTLLDRRGLRQAQVMVDVNQALIEHLIEDAVDPRYGARTLARRIERELIAPLARRLTTRQVERGLTRVRVSLSRSKEVELWLDVIREASPEPGSSPAESSAALIASSAAAAASSRKPDWLKPKGRAPLNAEQLVEALRELCARLDEFDARPELVTMSKEYERLLEAFNDPARQRDMLSRGDLTEQLRQREVVLARHKHVRARLDGLLDPLHEGVYTMPMPQEIDRQKQRHWSLIVSELDHSLIWLEVQLRSLLSRQNDGATLVIEGLSGPYSPLLDLWLLIARALDEAFELELAYAECSDEGRWSELDLRGTTRRQKIAISAESPGVFALFDTMAGYVWSPKLPSHGQHALILNRHSDKGFAQAKALREALQSGQAFALSSGQRSSLDPAEPKIEFIERDNQLCDLRLDRKLLIPQDRARNIRHFATRLVMERVALQDDVYRAPTRSGIWRALTRTDVLRHEGAGGLP